VNHLLRAAAIGVMATAVMDTWGVLREPLLGFPRANYRLIGRWFAYMPRGRFRHESIATAAPVPYEHAIGWASHYAVGISFSILLVQLGGAEWLRRPTLGLALGVGLATVIAPLFLMQPAMGAGFASSKVPNPRAAQLQSVLTHSIYGFGLYGAAWILALLVPLAR